MSKQKNDYFKIRVKAVKEYFASGSLEDIAISNNIHPKTLRRWVKWYKEGGKDNLNRKGTFRRHPRMFDTSIEKRIMLLKERKPSITISRAKKSLEREGIKVSRKGIWNVWRRYGLTGFVKERYSTSYREYLATVSVSQATIDWIKEMIGEKKVTEAAKVINSLPVFPYPEIIKEIPEHLLSIKRQVDRLETEFGKIPLSFYREKAKILRQKLEEKKMYYSSLRAGLEECYALMWLGEPIELLKLANAFKKRVKGLRDSGLRFAILLFEGHGLGSLLRIQGALKCADKCKVIIRHLHNPHFFMGELAGLYSILGYFRDAIYWTSKALEEAAGGYRKHLYASLAGFLTTSGEYSTALKILKEGKPKEWDYRSRAILIEAFAFLDKGKFQEASSLSVKALDRSKKEEIKRFLHLATLILACSHAAAGKKKEAKNLLRKYNPLLNKHHLEKEYLLRKILLEDLRLPKKALLVPTLRLSYLFYQAKITMYVKDYRKALMYAHSQKLYGLFVRLALFFPEPVLHLLKKGKKPELPKAFLKMPVFQINPPVYHIRFIGRLQICKGEKSLRMLKLTPKDRSFLIHLALKAGEPDKSISLDKIYHNFWRKSVNPSRNLSHLLVRIKKTLKISSHLIEISYKKDNPVLINKGIHFITDYDEYKQSLAQAKALLRAGEWGFAKREFLRAFKLFRGEPFKKMYDDWSDDKRLEVLFGYEKEVRAFADELIKRGRKEEAEKLIKKAERIVPNVDLRPET